MKLKKILSAIVSSAVMMTASVTSFSSLTAVNSADDGVMRDMTSMELVRDMGVGINLGNTMESCGDWIAQWGSGGFAPDEVGSYETAWGSPIITQDMIKGYAAQGFGVVRVPVAWSNLMGSNYQISDEYFARVKQIVDWVIEEDMYAIINIHYDSGWLHNLPTDPDGCKNRFKVMWEQIADYFKDYSDYLMFESQNEELGWGDIWNQWTGTAEQKAKSYAYVNEVNQIFVDTVRTSGGNNDKRHLLISGYNTDITLTCDPLFEMPDDPANRSSISVHYYTPAGFAILEQDADWAECRETWGTEADFAELETNMDLMKTTYIDKGIPVIIGEYGCPKDLKEGDVVVGQKDPESVRLFLSSVCQEAYERQMCPVLWDITGLHYDRTNCCLYDQELRENFNEISGFQFDSEATVPTQPTEAPTEERTYTEVDVNYTTQSYGWEFDPKDADAVKFTFTAEKANAGISGCIGWWINSWDYVNWSGNCDSNGKFTAIVDLPEDVNLNGIIAQLQCNFCAIWDNSIGDNVNVSVTLDDLNLVYYDETPVVTTATDPVETTTTTTVTTVTDPVETTKETTTTVTTTQPVVTTIITIHPTELPVLPAIKGDVNRDGNVNVSDVVSLNRILLGKYNFDEKTFENSDMNGDDKLNVFDVVLLKRFVINL